MSTEQEIAFIRAKIAKLEAEIEALSEDDGQGSTAAMSEWISVEDTLPEEYGKYLVTCASKYRPFVIVMKYDTCFQTWINPFEHKVTHWMPLPEPAREGSKHEPRCVKE